MPTFVYIMSCNGAMKIGRADDPERRAKDLQTGSAFPIKLVDSYQIRAKGFAKYVEKRVHKHLSDIHMSGEWFKEDVSRAQETIQGVIISNSRRGTKRKSRHKRMNTAPDGAMEHMRSIMMESCP